MAHLSKRLLLSKLRYSTEASNGEAPRGYTYQNRERLKNNRWVSPASKTKLCKRSCAWCWNPSLRAASLRARMGSDLGVEHIQLIVQLREICKQLCGSS